VPPLAARQRWIAAFEIATAGAWLHSSCPSLWQMVFGSTVALFLGRRPRGLLDGALVQRFALPALARRSVEP